MKKVFCVTNDNTRVITTFKTAEKNGWWITHNLDVEILPVSDQMPVLSKEPEIGAYMDAKDRYYKVKTIEKVLICRTCKEKANHRAGFYFYCKPHYRFQVTTSPIRKGLIEQNLNAPCICGSGLKFKYCCLSKGAHGLRHYFHSPYMQGSGAPKSQTL